MRVLVCGGREYGEVPAGCPAEQYRFYARKAEKERFLLEETLYVQDRETRFSALIHGGAAGADRWAKYWAQRQPIRIEQYLPDWTKGKSAGPLRNQRMIEEGKPDLVIAFPGGRGTADMVSRAKKAGVVSQFEI